MSTDYSIKSLKITDSAGTTTSYPFNASYWGGYTMAEICTGTYPDTGATFVGKNPTAVWNNAYGPYLDKDFISNLATSGTTLSYDVFNPIQDVGDTKTLSTDTKVKSPYKWIYIDNKIKLWSSAVSNYILSLKPIENIDMGITTFVNFKFPLTDTSYVTYKFGGSCSSSAITGTTDQQVLHYKEGTTEYWYKDAPTVPGSPAVSLYTLADCQTATSNYCIYAYVVYSSLSATSTRWASTATKAAAGTFDNTYTTTGTYNYILTGYGNSARTTPAYMGTSNTYDLHVAKSTYHSKTITGINPPTSSSYVNYYRNLTSMGYYRSGAVLVLVNPYHISVSYSVAVTGGTTYTGTISWGSIKTITIISTKTATVNFTASGYAGSSVYIPTGTQKHFVYLYSVNTSAATLRSAASVSVTYYAYDVATHTACGSCTCSSSSSSSFIYYSGGYGVSGGNIIISTGSTWESAMSNLLQDSTRRETIYLHLA